MVEEGEGDIGLEQVEPTNVKLKCNDGVDDVADESVDLEDTQDCHPQQPRRVGEKEGGIAGSATAPIPSGDDTTTGNALRPNISLLILRREQLLQKSFTYQDTMILQ